MFLHSSSKCASAQRICVKFVPADRYEDISVAEVKVAYVDFTIFSGEQEPTIFGQYM